MGADLYIRSITDRANDAHSAAFEAACIARDAAPSTEKDAAQARVDECYNLLYPPEAYFRDSYNDSCLFWRYGFTWLRDFPSDDDGEWKVDVVREVLERIRSDEVRDHFVGVLACIADRSHSDFREYTEEEAGERVSYFTAKDARFQAFLERAIELNEPIYVST